MCSDWLQKIDKCTLDSYNTKMKNYNTEMERIVSIKERKTKIQATTNK